jgi:hypothetical protein
MFPLAFDQFPPLQLKIAIDGEEIAEVEAILTAVEELTKQSRATEHGQGSKCEKACDAMGLAFHTKPKGLDRPCRGIMKGNSHLPRTASPNHRPHSGRGDGRPWNGWVVSASAGKSAREHFNLLPERDDLQRVRARGGSITLGFTA